MKLKTVFPVVLMCLVMPLLMIMTVPLFSIRTGNIFSLKCFTIGMSIETRNGVLIYDNTFFEMC